MIDPAVVVYERYINDPTWMDDGETPSAVRERHAWTCARFAVDALRATGTLMPDEANALRAATDQEVASVLRTAATRELEHARSVNAARDALLQEIRAGLRDAVEGMEDMISYVSDYFREKWDHDGYLARAKALLAKLDE